MKDTTEKLYMTLTAWCELVRLFWRSVWQYILKLKMLMPYNTAILLFNIYPRDKLINV